MSRIVAPTLKNNPLNKPNLKRINNNQKYSFAFIFPRFSGPYGGEKICLQLADQLIKLGHSVDLYTTFLDPQAKKNLNSQVKIIEKPRLKIKSHNLANLMVYFIMPLLAKKIYSSLSKKYSKGKKPSDHQKKYDFIVGQTWQSALALWRLRKKFKNVSPRPLLVYHCFEPPRFLYDLKKESSSYIKLISFFIRYLDQKAVQKGPDEIISISDLVKKWVLKIYQKDSKIIYPGIELERFKKYTKEQARQILKLPLRKKIFLSISKLHKRKRLKWAMRIFKQKDQEKNALLIIAGKGPEEENLKRYVKQLKIQKRVKFIGAITEDDVVLWHKTADYFIFTAKNEPYGIAPQEAKVCGSIILPKERPYPIWSWKKSAQEFLNSLPKA